MGLRPPIPPGFVPQIPDQIGVGFDIPAAAPRNPVVEICSNLIT